MPSQKNIQQLTEVKEKVDRATAMFVVDYAGLTHQQLEEARRELSDNASEIAVIKNTLMNLALAEKNVDAKEQLQGPAATLFSYEDPIKTAKILSTFIKKYGLPKIKFGYFEGAIIDEAMITKLATLPSKEILIAKLLGTLNAPISNFVYGLNANIVKLAQLLKAIEEKKAKEAPVVADATPVETQNEAPAQEETAAEAVSQEAPAETPSETVAASDSEESSDDSKEESAAPAEEPASTTPETNETEESVESKEGESSN